MTKQEGYSVLYIICVKLSMNGVLITNYGSIMYLTVGLKTKQRYIHVIREVSLYNSAVKARLSFSRHTPSFLYKFFLKIRYEFIKYLPLPISPLTFSNQWYQKLIALNF